MTLYHQEACEAVDEDSLLELCDWCYRKMLYLNSKEHKQSSAKGIGLLALIAAVRGNMMLQTMSSVYEDSPALACSKLEGQFAINAQQIPSGKQQ